LSSGEKEINIDYGGAEEVTKEKFEARKETLPLDEVLRKAKSIINPSYIE
jgi:hypothetical protein